MSLSVSTSMLDPFAARNGVVPGTSTRRSDGIVTMLRDRTGRGEGHRRGSSERRWHEARRFMSSG